jgi:exodeoxyribonuclease-3
MAEAFSLLTWNVNSIRARLDATLTYIDEQQPDIVCLQETKVEDRMFPRVPFMELGYVVTEHGSKGYAGVATLTRGSPDAVFRGFRSGPEDEAPRLLEVVLGELVVYNLYVPNGQAVGSEAFAYKLGWLRRLRRELDAHHRAEESILLCGDFNIAPDERDVYSVEAMRGHTHFTDAEHEALADVCDFGLRDCFRRHCGEGGHFSWFDYRGASLERGEGLRIDLVLASASLVERCREVVIDLEPRRLDKASDHAPVRARFSGS